VQGSEQEVREWWLVAPELGERLSAAGLPVLQFGELRMWGRFHSGGELADDPDLRGAIGAAQSAATSPSVRAPQRRARPGRGNLASAARPSRAA